MACEVPEQGVVEAGWQTGVAGIVTALLFSSVLLGICCWPLTQDTYWRSSPSAGSSVTVLTALG